METRLVARITRPTILPLQWIDEGDRGVLVVIEKDCLPFAIKRVFFVYGVRGWLERGGHAHKTCQQMLIAVQGQFKVIAWNKRGTTRIFKMTQPDKGLFVPTYHMTRIYEYTKDAICLVLASEDYDPNDYIPEFTANP